MKIKVCNEYDGIIEKSYLKNETPLFRALERLSQVEMPQRCSDIVNCYPE